MSLFAALTVMLCSAQAKYTDFRLKDVSGKEHSFKEYVKKGKKNYVLIDFWASWCGPCCREMPNIKEAYDKYHKKGFQIVGVSLDFKADAWKRAIEKIRDDMAATFRPSGMEEYGSQQVRRKLHSVHCSCRR